MQKVPTKILVILGPRRQVWGAKLKSWTGKTASAHTRAHEHSQTRTHTHTHSCGKTRLLEEVLREHYQMQPSDHKKPPLWLNGRKGELDSPESM